MTYNFSNELVSDLHKDTRGYRPSGDWMYAWSECSSDQKENIWNNLCSEMEASMTATDYIEKKAADSFEVDITKNIQFGAPDRETAIRWILQPHNLSENDLMYGGDYICYLLGLNYSYSIEFTGVCKTLLNMMEEA